MGLVHRRREMVARVTTSQRSEADEAKPFIEDYAIPSLRERAGFLGAYFLADREHETGISRSPCGRTRQQPTPAGPPTAATSPPA